MPSHPRIALLSFAHYHANFWTEAFLSDGDATVSCLWDDDRARGEEASVRFGVRFEPDLAIALQGCDAVAICSETVQHPALALAACRAGRAILCEKPTARSVAEADQIAAAVAQSGVFFMQSFPKRLDPASFALKTLVDSGRLGRIHLARVRHGHFYGLEPGFRDRWYMDPVRSGGGALLDEGVHGADLLHWFFGLPDTVTAEIASPIGGPPADETGTALFRYGSGMLAELTASVLLPAADVSIELYGTRATALLSGVDLASRDITSDGFLRISVEEAGAKRWEIVDITPRFKIGQFHHQNAIRFLHCLRTGAPPPASLADGRAALLMIEAAYRAARLGVRQTVEPNA
jgi:predicted dehydrogenase